jgi:hypothetical protein
MWIMVMIFLPHSSDLITQILSFPDSLEKLHDHHLDSDNGCKNIRIDTVYRLPKNPIFTSFFTGEK